MIRKNLKDMEEQIVIPVGEQAVWGILYTPDRSPQGSILICPPLLEEMKSSCRVLVEAARDLQKRGFVVFRLDYRGCGDSPGKFETYTLHHWLEDIREASAWLQEHTQARNLGLLGLRTGGTLAVCAAKDREMPPVKALSLWEPVLNGPQFLYEKLREKIMKEMLTFGKAQSSRDQLCQKLSQGEDVDLDGYKLTPDFYRQLSDTDLTEYNPGKTTANVRVISITSNGKLSKVAATWQTALKSQYGVGVPEFSAFKSPLFWNLVGHVSADGLLTETGRWFEKTMAEANTTA